MLAVAAYGQGNFQNLDFEAPTLPLVHVGGGFDFVAVAGAVPGWTLFLGTNQVGRVLFNNFFLGTATVGLMGPGLTNSFPIWPRIIDGSYTIVLQAGTDISEGPVNPPLVDAGMTQSGLVPVSASSIQLKAYTLGGANAQFVVSLNGFPIDMLPLEVTPNYTLYGGDISIFAGSTAELRIAALTIPAFAFSAFAFDSIAFVPEPSVFALLGLGALFIGWRLFHKSRA